MKKPRRGAGGDGEIMKYEDYGVHPGYQRPLEQCRLYGLLPDGNAERRSGRVYPAEGSAGTGSLF